MAEVAASLDAVPLDELELGFADVVLQPAATIAMSSNTAAR